MFSQISRSYDEISELLQKMLPPKNESCTLTDDAESIGGNFDRLLEVLGVKLWCSPVLIEFLEDCPTSVLNKIQLSRLNDSVSCFCMAS